MRFLQWEGYRLSYTLITGASAGIGRAAAFAFAKRGSHLLLVARRLALLEALKAEVVALYPTCDVVVIATDLSLRDQVYALYEQVRSYDIKRWINNAGFGDYAKIGELNLEKIEQLLHLNIEALTILTSLYVKDHAHVEGSQLVNVSSVGGYAIVADAVTYCASKFYVSAFTEGLAHEMQRTGAKLSVKLLAPAATETEFAQIAREAGEFDYAKALPKYHTATQMADFLVQLCESDNVVGIVDPQTYDFVLRDPIYPNASNTAQSQLSVQ